jgi:hypothetical protein
MVYENQELRRILEHARDKVTGRGRKLYEDFHIPFEFPWL